MMTNSDNLFPITNNIFIVLGYPFLFLKDVNALVAADLHLGIENIMAEDGTYVPYKQTQEVIKDFEKAINLLQPDTLVLVGDVKHSYAQPTKIENKEVSIFLNAIKQDIKTVHITKGNHDIFLNWITNKLENVILHDNFQLERYFFTHGHLPLSSLPSEVEYVIIGHEHPLFKYRVDNLQIIKTPAFLVGPLLDYSAILIVLPSFSPYSLGVAVSPINQSSLLSPILQQQVDLNKFESYVMGEKKEIFHFPPFEKWYR